MNLIFGIISSILATCIVAGFVYAYHQGILRDWWDKFFTVFRSTTPSVAINSSHDSTKLRTILLRRLRQDQSRSGIHYGQFGRYTNLVEEQKFQTGAEKKNLMVKPRLYLTAWPGIILATREIAPRQLALATKGIKRLFVNNRIHISPPAARQTPPQRQPRMISYRHTICGALFLYYVQGCGPIVHNVIAAMLDKRNQWQNRDGGWAQCNQDYTGSDLWGSAYAARLLDKVVADEPTFSDLEHALAIDSLTQTLEYLKNCWQRNKWAYGGSPSEENAVLILIEIAPLLLLHDKQFLNDVVDHIHQWLDPSGDLSDNYLSICRDTSHASLYTRMSYAFCRSVKKTDLWVPLYHRASERIDEELNSADMAFLLDLTYLASQAQQQVINEIHPTAAG
jgi:hypothetical protein